MVYATQLVAPSTHDAHEWRARVERRLAASPFLAGPLRHLGYDSESRWAWENYRAVALGLAEACHGASGAHIRMLEIGGGRGPLLTPAAASAAGIDVTVNDIDARELAMGPPEFAKTLFDVGGDVDPALHGRFDLIVSRMVMEHVADARRAWANMAALLAPGGVALAFHPTLYAPPFLINLAFPERITAPILRHFFPYRNDSQYPKFPAHYDLCFGDQAKVEPVLRDCGFSQALVAPFWGHGYFQRIPGLREVDAAISRLAEARDWRAATTYAYTLARR